MCIRKVGEETGTVSVKLSTYSFLLMTDSLLDKCVVKGPRTSSLATVVPER